MRPRMLFLNRWPQYRGTQRWDNELARPEDIIDHNRYRVTYLSDVGGQPGVPAEAEEVHLVDFGQVDSIQALVDEIVAKAGPFDYVIAFSEYLLDLAAAIRERHGIAGALPHEVDRFRDKTIMKTTLAKSQVRVPRWIRCESTEQVLAGAETLGYPLIFKPVRGGSSQGVYHVASAEQLRSLCAVENLVEHEIEEYITGDLMHVDGIVDERGECLFMSTSRYISDCLAFESGEPLGSIIQTDPDTRSECERFARRVLAALELKASAFHLEFFDTGQELVFLEIGARVPGADVAYVIRDAYGVNMFHMWVQVMLGEPVRPPEVTFAESSGWLMIPRPKPLPQKVVAATPMLGGVPLLYRELVPRPGDILVERIGSYATLQGGRFLFRGGTEAQIADAMRSVRAKYQLTAVPVAGPSD